MVGRSKFTISIFSLFVTFNISSDPPLKDGTDENEWHSPVKDDFELDTEISASENKEEIIERAKAGWNIKNVEAIRIGDLYLMVSNNDYYEYVFDANFDKFSTLAVWL